MEKTTGAMQEFQDPRAPADASSSAGLVLLYAENYAELPAAWPLKPPARVIGREHSADLTLLVRAVSRQHAELRREGDIWCVRDLGSTNGTLVDGRRVDRAQLEALSELRVGDAILKFVDRDAEAYARYAVDGSMRGGAQRLSQHSSALVGGYQMDRIAAEIERIAPSELNVVLTGESGTGKEVVARELHRLSGRRGGFCAVNCAAIPGTLLESELFGYKRGAFSGADRDKTGVIRAAHGGTLLLDEIGDMPLDAQAKLLRILQNREVVPLGATTPEQVDVRFVCATHRDLARLQQAGKFRPDLFARLNEYQLRLPPLRDRKEDILLLVGAFSVRHGRPELVPSFGFMTGLLQYDWPYNVRELEACVKRCIALTDAPLLEESKLPDSVREAMLGYGQPAAREDSAASSERPGMPTEAELRALLHAHGGNIAAVGRQLGKARMQVHRWLKRYAISVDEFR